MGLLYWRAAPQIPLHSYMSITVVQFLSPIPPGDLSRVNHHLPPPPPPPVTRTHAVPYVISRLSPLTPLWSVWPPVRLSRPPPCAIDWVGNVLSSSTNNSLALTSSGTARSSSCHDRCAYRVPVVSFEYVRARCIFHDPRLPWIHSRCRWLTSLHKVPPSPFFKISDPPPLKTDTMALEPEEHFKTPEWVSRLENKHKRVSEWLMVLTMLYDR